MTNEDRYAKIESLVKNKLSQYLGVGLEDVSNDDSLRDDLHMNPADISDFLKLLADEGVSTDFSEIQQIESVTDIIEKISEEEDF